MDKSEMRAALDEAYAALEAATTEIARLQTIIDSRPAINAALPENYIAWSQSIYMAEAGFTPSPKDTLQ